MIMTNSIKFLITLFFILFSAASQAQNFYVCDSNGSDDFDGRSEAKPFQTYTQSIWKFNELKGGESLLFCRGGKFEANTAARLYNRNCSASNPCTIGDYGDENLPRPVISANGVHAINFENGGGARQDGGYIVKNLTLIAATKSGAGVQLFNDVDDVLITNMHIEGFNIGVYSAGSNVVADGAISNQMNDRLIVQNSTIIKNKKIGFLGACNDCLIDNNHFENNGNHPSLDHNIYLAQKSFPAKGITIRNNTLYKSAIVDGRCQGVSLVGHGLLEDVLIENNIIKEDINKVSGGCWGISIDPGYSTMDEAFRNITIRKNKIINVGGVGIGCASCDGVLIEDNEIIDEGNVLRAGVSVPVREENILKSKNVMIKGNKVILTRDDAYGIHIGGLHQALAMGNEISLPTNTRMECFKKEGFNLNTDTSNNICKTHNGVALIDEENSNVVPTPEEEQVVENTIPVDESAAMPEQEIVDNVSSDGSLNNQEQEVVDNNPVIESPDTSVPVSADNSSVEDENLEQDFVVNAPINDDINIISEPSETVQTPTSDVAETDSITTTDESNPTLNSKSRKAAGGGSSGGGSSKTKKSSSSSTTPDLATSDGVVSYSSTESATEDTITVMSVETEQMDITDGIPKTDSGSSKYSVKVKDVIAASRIENEVADVTQCRAYAAGRCLMR